MIPVYRSVFSVLRSAFFIRSLFFLVGLLLPLSAFAQDAPLDSSEISRDLLYVAPLHGEACPAGDTIWYCLVGHRFTYSETTSGEHWSIRSSSSKWKEPPKKTRVFSLDPYELVSASDDDRATLALRKKGSQEPIATATLWDRDQLAQAWLPQERKHNPRLTVAALQQDLEVADPEVRASAKLVSVNKGASDQPILVAVGQSTGEGEFGLATIVKFEPGTGAVAVYHPPAIPTCEISAIGVSANSHTLLTTIWFGSRAAKEGLISPCVGLARLDPQTRQVAIDVGGKNPPIGSIVTLIASGARLGSLTVATDAGICNLKDDSGKSWDCWRFVPTVTLAAELPIANSPGSKPYGNLKPGDYEVLWANQNFLEVVTNDSFDAWLAADDYAEAAARNFDVEPYKLLNTSAGGPSPIRLLAEPRGAPLNGALVYRAPLEKLPTPSGTPAGWVKVRTRIGWIPRGNLEVAVKLVPAAK